ncbi:MAG: DOMON-like domain-containing protein [Pseudomonadota bacterium]|jgi:hypothetical protein
MQNTKLQTLLAHPTAEGAVTPVQVTAMAQVMPGSVLLFFRLGHARHQLRLPTAAGGQRADGLWRQTCCEAFLGVLDGPEYLECNLATNGDWALYHFAGYRDALPLPSATPPVISADWDGDDLLVRALFDRALWPQRFTRGSLTIGLSAVLALPAGGLSYHALAHPRDVPDFHDARARQAALGVLVSK